MYVHLYVYVFLFTFCNSFFFSFFVPLGPFGLIIEWHFPKRCRGLIRTLPQCMQPLVGSSCCVLQPKYGLKFQPFVALVTFLCLYLLTPCKAFRFLIRFYLYFYRGCECNSEFHSGTCFIQRQSS